MVTFRFYLFSMMMIFLFLGVGIFIGNNLSNEWIGKRYQTIIINLEKKLNNVSIEKNHLKQKLSEAIINNDEITKAWISFYKTHIGKEFKDRSVVVVTNSLDQFHWLNILHEVGLKVKLASSIDELSMDQTDIIILNQPSEEELTKFKQNQFTAEEMVINQKAIPAGKRDSVYYISLKNNDEKDIVSLLEGIYVLLSKRGY